MSKKISDGIYAVGGNRGAAIFFSKEKGPQFSAPKINKDSTDSGEWCNWGDDNLWPQNLIRKLNKVGTAGGGLDVLTSAHYGVGIEIYQEVDNEDGTDTTLVKRALSKLPEIQAFFRRCSFNITLSEIIDDSETFGIAFPEYLTTPNVDEIISVQRLQAANYRFGIPKNGFPEKVIYNSDWETYNKDFNTETVCFNPRLSVEEIKAICKEKRITNFIIPVMDALVIEKIYPTKKWHSSFKNGWIDVVLSVPAFKKAMFENQFNFKSIVHVADDYFAHKYGMQDWQKFSAAEKELKREELVTAVDDHMSGNDAAGRSLISPFFRDASGKEIKGIQIETIPQNQSNGEFLLDASAGNSEILFPMGVDPSLLGGGIPGGKNLSGSGSDKREAYTILCARLPKKQIRTLKVFDIVQEWNGWDPSLIAKLPNVNLTTLDKNPNGQQKIVN